MNEQLKKCECGCGTPTKLNRNGQPRRFTHGHNRRNTGVGWLEQGQWYISINGKKKAFHRWVVEERDGRSLGSDEIVHHVDRDPLNNDPDNLVVLSRAEHARLHYLTDTLKPWTAEERARILALRRAKMSIQEIAAIVGRTYSSVRSQLTNLKNDTAETTNRAMAA
jgi:hypothetical protein